MSEKNHNHFCSTACAVFCQFVWILIDNKPVVTSCDGPPDWINWPEFESAADKLFLSCKEVSELMPLEPRAFLSSQSDTQETAEFKE